MTQEMKPANEKKTKKTASSLDTPKPKKVTEKKEKTSTTKKVAKTKTTVAEKKEKKETKKTTKASAKKTTTKKKSTTTSTSKTTKASHIRKSASKKGTTLLEKSAVPASFLPEYYDLPYRYNQTIIRILYQTPTTLFVYWDISDADRESYKEQFGENFFEISKPVLIIHNKTKDYYFEVEIDDFANSWYLHVNDSDCVYEIELGRRAKFEKQVDDLIPNNYLYIASSNDLETPNDHILLDTIKNFVSFKDTKQEHVFEKPISDLHLMQHLEPSYPIYEIYHKLYKEELQGVKLRGSNPSSGSFVSNI